MIVSLKSLTLLSLKEPRKAMRAVLQLPLGQGEAISALTVVSALSAILLFAVDYLTSPSAELGAPILFFASPFTAAGLQLGFLMLTAWIAQAVGKSRGGQGTLRDMILVAAWLEALMLILQVAQVLLLTLLPGLATLLLPITLAAFFWFLTNFITEAHKFQSLGKVFAGVVITMLVTSFALSFLLAILMGLGG